ncbi:type II secretion system F family protein [Candidatus Woesearchaeota archaeon]|nr:type II secretion system F family protein [Candidatus Woesearchaeota archaeon]
MSDKITLSRRERDYYLRLFQIEDEVLKLALPKRIKEEVKKEYELYEGNLYGRFCNGIMEGLTINLTNKYPEFFSSMVNKLILSQIKILSKTFISMILFTSLLSTLVSFVIYLFLFYFYSTLTLTNIVLSGFFGLFTGILVFVIFYYYPSTEVDGLRKKIKEDLPFVIVHMSAVAGSGARPSAVFTMLLKSKEYPGLEGEIKKIVNYINLFGYDLSTALRTVARTTPSVEFRDLLNGMVSTITTGGSLKEYLKAKADEAITQYRLDRKRYVESLSTYSEVYIGLLVAAPLLFFVTLAIINSLGSTVAGLPISTVAYLGIFILLPALNMIFYAFLSFVQPKG